MATQHSRSAARVMMAPAVILLLGWMLVPLTMTLWFSFRQYLPLRGGDQGFIGFENYIRFISSSSFWPAVQTTLVIVLGVLAITVILGIFLAMLLDQPIWGQGVVRIMVIAPFFVMPTVSALVWKNIFYGSRQWPVRAFVARLWGRTCCVVIGCADYIADHDCLVAMAAFCHADFANRDPIFGW